MKEIKNTGSLLVAMKKNLIDLIWDKKKAQSIKTNCIRVQQGDKSVTEKIIELRLYLFEKGASGIVLTNKDELEWIFNCRFQSNTELYAIISKHGAIMYVDQLDLLEMDHLSLFKIRPCYEFFNDTASLATQLRANDKVIVSDNTYTEINTVIGKNHIIEEEYSFIKSRKSIPTKTECSCIKKCYLRDGAAISTFLTWLENKLNSNNNCVDIIEAETQLDYYRKLQENYEMSETSLVQKPLSNSLQSNSISCKIQLGNSIFINSSGKYSDGTTNFTGTFHFKNPCELDKRYYTRVLQTHIAIDTFIFPSETTGDIVDSIGRQALWKEGLDSDSSFIKNHYNENMNRIPLTAGMLLSNEPSCSNDAVFCVKNTVLVKQIDTPLCPNSHSLGFQPISFVPLCRRLIEVNLLSLEERSWINTYHKECFEQLSPRVNDKTLAWLSKETCPM